MGDGKEGVRKAWYELGTLLLYVDPCRVGMTLSLPYDPTLGTLRDDRNEENGREGVENCLIQYGVQGLN